MLVQYTVRVFLSHSHVDSVMIDGKLNYQLSLPQLPKKLLPYYLVVLVEPMVQGEFETYEVGMTLR